MSRIIPPADAADMALAMYNAADLILRSSGLSMTPEVADAVDAALVMIKRKSMRYRKELKCSRAVANRAARDEARRNAALDAEKARLLADAEADEAGRLAKYAAETAEQVAA